MRLVMYLLVELFHNCTYSTTASAGKDGLKVDSAVEAERTIGENVDPVSLVVSGGVENGNLVFHVSVSPLKILV